MLSAHGFNGSTLKVFSLRKDKVKTISVTAPQSRERQDILPKVSTTGSRFYATGGEMLNSDDFFITEERKERNDLIKKLEMKKAHWLPKSTLEQEAKTVIEKYRTTKNKDMYSQEGAKALDALSLKILYKWKYGKTPKAGLKKSDLLVAWNAAKLTISDIDNTCKKKIKSS